MTIQEKIQSIRQTLNASYVKPNPAKVDEYIKSLKENTQAMDYLNVTRGLTKETIEYFKLGYDPVKNAITIPIFKRDELVNIKYRHLEPKGAKYSQEKGAEVWIFNEQGIDKAKEKGQILVVEGEIDCMTAWQAGFRSVVSPASGKDSYGVWIELLDNIPKVYVSYDNDKPGKIAALELADRVGLDKTYEVVYPDGIKDANEFFKKYDLSEYNKLVKKAQPFYSHKYQNLGSVIEEIKLKGDNRLRLDTIPFVKFGTDWMAVISGSSGIGKTSYVMNIANELVEKNIPTLVLPFERGIKSVGARFIQVRCHRTEDELIAFDDGDWNKVIPDLIDLPLYFSMPESNDISHIVTQAKKYFGIKVVIIDHLDYSITTGKGENEVSIMKKILQGWKSIAIEQEIIFLVVHHINKPANGLTVQKPKKENLKGGSSVYQVPEAVIMLSEPEDNKLEITVDKNKGKEGSKIYEFNKATGVVGDETEIKDIKVVENRNKEEKEKEAQKAFDSF